MSPPKTLTADQCVQLLDELRVNQGTDKQVRKGFRNYCMAMLMLETGIRVGELCGLHIDELWFADQPVSNLVIRKEIAKNKQERQIPISAKLSDTIIDMAVTVWLRKDVSVRGHAFYSNDPLQCLTTRSVERIIESAGSTALNMVVTPHMLRHTFGSKMMRKTNARVVQALLGHESLQSTQIYMHPNSEDLQKAINS